ncbi:hypothetical protein BBP40_002782 [Aspergillus hancockii]|nr:hypothetical protein BBP40_002782 [Aspergillus hancockii]
MPSEEVIGSFTFKALEMLVDQRKLAQPSLQPPGVQPSSKHSCARDCSELAQRIQRLERAVFPTGELGSIHDGPVASGIDPAIASTSKASNQDEEQQMTSQWLEDLLTTNTAARVPSTSPAAVEISVILRDFPIYSDAEMLLDYYTKTIDASYRMLHIPTTWRWLREFYADLKTNRLPSATQVSFFLGVFAGSAYASKNDFQFETAALRNHSQKALAESWVKQAVVLLTKPPVPPSVQALQTAMNLAHLCTQIEGLSGSFGILSVTGLQMARSMKIHRLDSAPYREERRKNGADLVDLEVKRRIWWHMVASDWLLSYVPGPNEGTYTLHPRQMETFHPSNVEDGDIPTGITHTPEESYNLALSSATSMTYFLHRIQSATLVREVVDRLPPSFFASPGTESCDEVYDNIMALDQKYQQFLQSLPPFFQLTITDHSRYQALLREKPYLEWQRYLINFVVHTQLARLHRPFLIRGSKQHKLAYSRMQCIKSAETVIEIRNRAMSDHSIGAFTFVLQHFLMAAMILAMDVCFNPDNIQVPQRKQYVLRACRALEEELNAKIIPGNGAANENTSSGQFMVRSFQKAVQSLRGVLRKRMNEDESDSAAATEASAKDVPISLSRPGGNAYSAMHGNSSGQTDDIINHSPEVNPYAHDYGATSQTRLNPEQGEEHQMSIAPPPPYHVHMQRELEETHVPGELIVDELWDEFFTVGSTFNDTDWDTFLLDVGEQIGGMK